MALWKRLRDERGAVVVEFAIILPVLMMVVFAVIDLSRFFFTLSTLSASVREGARYGAVMTADQLASDGPGKIRERVRGSFQPFGTPPLTDADIEVDPDLASGFITVSVPSYDFDLLTPFPYDITMPPRQAVFRWERAP
ncbi:MAG: TadE/TadG family type IV pilus assembly protein [Gemmatimonadaceae bacterium]